MSLYFTHLILIPQKNKFEVHFLSDISKHNLAW